MNREGATVSSRAAVAITTMSDDDFAAISRIIHAQTGIVMNAGKRSMLVSRLSRRIRKLGMQDFANYRRFLDSKEGSVETRELISAITTNVTSFFREPVHFDILADLVPSLMERAHHGERIRIWSAGCSSGEEPYSIAITLLEKWPEIVDADFLILATDIDSEIIKKGRSGIYPKKFDEKEKNAWINKYSQKTHDSDTFAIKEKVKRLIRFEELNLLGPWPFNGSFDIIFCRNVVIYFDGPTRLRLWRRFAERLQPDGMLFVGHSERVDPELDDLLEPVGVTQYRRRISPCSTTVQKTGASHE